MEYKDKITKDGTLEYVDTTRERYSQKWEAIGDAHVVRG